jgi:hypothetical protein
MEPTPTFYAGTKFRSRLEASWAAHFDARRMPWNYEPEGFILSDGTWYLPDFYLPTARAWAEVKGDHYERMSKVELFASDLWRESGATTTYDPTSPMVVLFRTPQKEQKPSYHPDNYPWYPLYDHGWDSCTTGPMGVMGPGKAYSAGWARCPTCHVHTIVAYWQPFCRNCGHIYEDGFEAFFDPDWANRDSPFRYLRADFKAPTR